MTETLFEKETDVSRALQKKYGNDAAREIIKVLNERFRENSNIELAMKILASPVRNSGAAITKGNFIIKLRNAGASVVRMERQLYRINNVPVWLLANGLTLKTRHYWSIVNEGDYETYVRKSHIVILCGCEETAIIIPPEVHNELFVPKRLENDNKTGIKWYSFVLTPREDHIEFTMTKKRVSINANEYLNNYPSLGIELKDLPTKETIIAAQYTAAEILESVSKSMARDALGEGRKRERRVKDELDGETMLSKTQSIFSDIDSFLNNSIEAKPDELFLWIWLCYRFKLYERGARLFRKIDRAEFPEALYKG